LDSWLKKWGCPKNYKEYVEERFAVLYNGEIIIIFPNQAKTCSIVHKNPTTILNIFWSY